MEIALSLIPVLLFLAILYLLDSFKLVRKKLLLATLVWGILSAAIAYFINSSILNSQESDFLFFAKYISPLIEELIKAGLIFLLIRKKQIGFMIDAAIYGFAIGTGFALFENIFYLLNTTNESMLIWIIRGFGTALMHGGASALLAILLIGGKSSNRNTLISGLMAISMAYLIHSVFNHFFINPIIQTICILILLPLALILTFYFSEKQLQQWLEIEFHSEVELLGMIKKGKFQSTNSGKYLASIKDHFSAETIVDMYCLMQLHLELSIKAKRNLMLKENEMPLIFEEDLESKLIELKQLRKQIGKTGELALSPLVRINYRELWKMNLLR